MTFEAVSLSMNAVFESENIEQICSKETDIYICI
jgi:hypothetical protein